MHAVLARETSCDESAAAVLRRDDDGRIEVLASHLAQKVLASSSVPLLPQRLRPKLASRCTAKHLVEQMDFPI